MRALAWGSRTSIAATASPAGRAAPSTRSSSSRSRADAGERGLGGEEPRIALTDHLALEPLAGSVDDPRRVDGAVDLADLEHVRVFVGIVQVREPRVVATGQQVPADHGLRGLVDQLRPDAEVCVAASGVDDAEAPGPGTVAADEQRQLLGRIQERVDHEHLAVAALGDEMHLQVGAALPEEGAGTVAHVHDRAEQVLGEDEVEVLDALELQVMEQSVLVAGPGGPERDEGGTPPTRSPSNPAAIRASSLRQVAALTTANKLAANSAGHPGPAGPASLPPRAPFYPAGSIL